MSNYCVSCCSKAPPILSHPHPKHPQEKVPDTLGASLWRGRGSDEYPKGQKRSLLTSVTANDPRGGVRWSQYVWTPTLNNNIKKKKKSVTLSEGYEVEVAGWAGAGG